MNDSGVRKSQSNVDSALDDPRVFEAVQEYLLALEAGQRPSRQAFLARFPDIRKPLGECLDALQLVHSTAGRTPGAPSATPSLASFAGLPAQTEPLGDFKIVREIGRGGMGFVYEAIQLSLGRRVALKVLPFAAALDAKHLQRFKNEAQAAALLHHNHIVPVFGVGCERGIHFYAMQLIEGQTVAALIRQLRREAGRDADVAAPAASPSAASTGPWIERPEEVASDDSTEMRTLVDLTTERTVQPRKFHRSVARLGVQAALALEHAHQNGVIHRDIKPANLMVDSRSHLWITDFGLAQFHAEIGLTRTGDLVGTLRYMSPEQALGQRVLLDHRTDVYSLGATLYEMLTLEPAFPATDRQALVRQLEFEEPRPPKSVDPTLPVELETIVLKAMSKSPADRYATAQALADDLQRFLDEQPILARRPTVVDRTRKWARRHPSLVAAAMLLLLMVVVGLIVHNRRLSSEQARTMAEYRLEREHYSQARKAVDVLIEVSEEELSDNPGMNPLRKKLLETALGFYQDFAEQHGDDPELAAVQEKVKGILAELSVIEGASRSFLLDKPAVIQDLALSPEQIRTIDGLKKQWERQWSEQFRNFRHLSPDERHSLFVSLARPRNSALKRVLTAAQVRRLGQIDLQHKGLWAFQDPAVVTALQLTPAQRAKIRDFEREIFMPLPNRGPNHRERGNGMGGPPPQAGLGHHGHGRRNRSREAVARVVKLLTPEQERRWQTLIGPPFEDMSDMGPGTAPDCPPDAPPSESH